MSKTYKWAASDDPGAGLKLHINGRAVAGKTQPYRRQSKAIWMMSAIRANLAGLPLRMKLGTEVYTYQDRSQITRLLDDLELLVKAGAGLKNVEVMWRWSHRVKQRGEILVTTKFFPAAFRSIEAHKAALLKAQSPAPAAPRPMGLPPSAALYIDRIIQFCSDSSGIGSVETLMRARCAGSGREFLGEWRHLTYWLIHHCLPEITTTAIAKYLQRDHTTVIYGIARVDASKALLARAEILAKKLRKLA